MSRILFINSVCNGSTGAICKNLYESAESNGHICCIAYGRGEAPFRFNIIKIGSNFDLYAHVIKSRLFDASGFGSKHATKKFIQKIEKFQPDIIHIHNLHGYYINIELLFNFLKSHSEIKKVWTLHDCWAFTGHCTHYTFEQCYQWKLQCKKCLQKNEYPKAFFSRCESNQSNKRKIFSNVSNMTIITPSKWLKKEVLFSFLNSYNIQVINNGVDTNIFKPTKSYIKRKYNLEGKKIILGVASVWEGKKGLKTFIELSKILNDDYRIILIGLSKKLISIMPSNIIGLKKTDNIYELVKWYSVADVFFNPTLEDNYPTVNLEAIACGTRVITFNTGGSPESAYASINNVIYDNSIDGFIKKMNLENCVLPKIEIVSLKKMQEKYLELYFE